MPALAPSAPACPGAVVGVATGGDPGDGGGDGGGTGGFDGVAGGGWDTAGAGAGADVGGAADAGGGDGALAEGDVGFGRPVAPPDRGTTRVASWRGALDPTPRSGSEWAGREVEACAAGAARRRSALPLAGVVNLGARSSNRTTAVLPPPSASRFARGASNAARQR